MVLWVHSNPKKVADAFVASMGAIVNDSESIAFHDACESCRLVG